MQHDPVKKWLHDAKVAAVEILEFTAGRSFDDYISDSMLRSAVERQFMIVGEALLRIRKENADMVERIPEHRKNIAFRNIVAHGYDKIDDRIVWEIVQKDVGTLPDQLTSMLRENE